MKFARRSAEQSRDEELDFLLAATRAAASSGDPQHTLEGVLDGALSLVGGDEGSIQMLDASTMALRVVASRGLPDYARAEVVAVGQGISGAVAVSGQPLLLPAAIDVGRFLGHVQKERRIFGSICVPLRSSDTTIGVLNVNRMRIGSPFTERDLLLVSLFGEMAAMAVDRTRLLEEAQRRAVELEMLRGATLRLTSSLDPDVVASTALQEAMAIASSDTGFICLSSADGPPLELARYAGISREALRLVLSSPSFRRFTAPTGLRIINDVATDPVLESLVDDVGARALALLPLRTADGRSDGIVGIAVRRDLETDVKHLLGTYATQAGLALSNALLHRNVSGHEEELATIVSSLDIPVLLIDDDGRFRSINPAAATTFRISPDFELGQPARGKLPETIEELALERDDDVDVEVPVPVGTEERLYRVTVATIRRGRRAGARIVVCTDLSAHHELERRKADFLAVIGHELRTPLTNIKGFASTLAAHGATLRAEMRDEAVRTILVQSERLERLIEDLLYVSRVENTRPPLHLAWDDVVGLCAEVVAEINRRHPQRPLRFTGPGDDMPILTDRIKVEQILTHLLDNALKYSTDTATVEVSIIPGEHSVSIGVRDEGPGIYSGDLERIFEPFVQLDSTSTRRSGGTGIGLYVCETLASILGARIEVESVLGKGSTFTLVLPRKTVDIQGS